MTQSSIHHRNLWARFVPNWRLSVVLVLEQGTGLSGGLHHWWRTDESRRQMALSESGAFSGTAPGSTGQPHLVCRSCDSVTHAVQLIKGEAPLAGILDLRSMAAESLYLLRQLQLSAIEMPMVAVGDKCHEELTPLLLEAGCSALLTHPPFHQDLTDFITRCCRQDKSCHEQP